MKIFTTANIILYFCVIKFLSALSKLVVKSEDSYAIIFYTGTTIFELFALYMWTKREDIKGTWREHFLYFSIGCAVFMLFKIFFTNPFTFTNTEYIELGVGFLFMIGQNVYAKLRKRTA